MHLAPNQVREEMSHTLQHNMVTLPFAVALSSVAIQRGARLPPLRRCEASGGSGREKGRSTVAVGRLPVGWPRRRGPRRRRLRRLPPGL